MGRPNSNGKLSKDKKKVTAFPEIHIDKSADFASVKIAKGIEAKSYVKDGFVFCEDKKGNIIEIQILNLSKLAKKPKGVA